ncbi:MAG: IS66 family transposase [Tenericutes bacterium]|nr:IS66 family transposase [Mycoplasmatota bacterium]
MPKKFLESFNGYLHVDGYAGYQAVDNITLIGCLVHVRRYFNDAYISLGNIPGIEDTATAKGLNYCNKLFALDKKSKALDLDQRFIFKQEKIKPMFVEFLTWVNNSSLDAMPKSKYGKALKYASNQLPNVMHYLEKAELDIDNNLAEISIKLFVIGRKNWLFSNTASGADASARLYSIVQTCILNNVNPYEYVDYVLDKLANMTINENTDIKALLPWSYSKN